MHLFGLEKRTGTLQDAVRPFLGNRTWGSLGRLGNAPGSLTRMTAPISGHGSRAFALLHRKQGPERTSMGRNYPTFCFTFSLFKRS